MPQKNSYRKKSARRANLFPGQYFTMTFAKMAELFGSAEKDLKRPTKMNKKLWASKNMDQKKTAMAREVDRLAAKALVTGKPNKI